MSTQRYAPIGYSPENAYIDALKEDEPLHQLLDALQRLTNTLHSQGALKVLAAHSNDPALNDMATLAVSLRQKMLQLLRRNKSSSQSHD